MIHETVIIHPGVQCGDGIMVGPFAVLGQPYRPVADEPFVSDRPTIIGRGSYVGSHVVVGQGTQMGDHCILEDGTAIEVGVSIGVRAHFLYRAQVCNEANIGDDCVIGGFICERAVVGPRSRVFGDVVHRQLNPTAAWDDEEEDAPTIEAEAFIGFGAKVIGGVRIGRRSYVCAGAILTRNLPEDHVASGVNQICHYKEWKGDLSRSPLFVGDGND